MQVAVACIMIYPLYGLFINQCMYINLSFIVLKAEKVKYYTSGNL